MSDKGVKVTRFKKKRFTYPKENVQSALNKVAAGMTVAAAATKYQIPDSTLQLIISLNIPYCLLSTLAPSINLVKK